MACYLIFMPRRRGSDGRKAGAVFAAIGTTTSGGVREGGGRRQYTYLEPCHRAMGAAAQTAAYLPSLLPHSAFANHAGYAAPYRATWPLYGTEW